MDPPWIAIYIIQGHGENDNNQNALNINLKKVSKSDGEQQLWVIQCHLTNAYVHTKKLGKADDR